MEEEMVSPSKNDRLVKLPAHPVKTGQARLGLPGNEDMIL